MIEFTGNHIDQTLWPNCVVQMAEAPDVGQKTEEQSSVSVEEVSDSGKNKPLFRDIDAEDDDPEIMQIESLCVKCESQVTMVIISTEF